MADAQCHCKEDNENTQHSVMSEDNVKLNIVPINIPCGMPKFKSHAHINGFSEALKEDVKGEFPANENVKLDGRKEDEKKKDDVRKMNVKAMCACGAAFKKEALMSVKNQNPMNGQMDGNTMLQRHFNEKCQPDDNCALIKNQKESNKMKMKEKEDLNDVIELSHAIRNGCQYDETEVTKMSQLQH